MRGKNLEENVIFRIGPCKRFKGAEELVHVDGSWVRSVLLPTI